MVSDAGIDLMNVDADITESIIHYFTKNEVPILSLHDSYIVPYGLEDDLEVQMKEAFKAVTGIDGVKVRDDSFQPKDWEPEDLERGINFDWKAWELDKFYSEDPPRSKRYLYIWNLFMGKNN